MNINNKEYKEIKLLGKGKSGYSYLVKDNNNFLYVAKKIHNEPCEYYEFGDKLESEINDYNYLISFLDIPKIIDIDYNNKIILKEYLEENTISELISKNIDISKYIVLIKNISIICKEHNINIDYYPTNFIFHNSKLFYIDYECNKYCDEWNYENWGSKYWKLND